MVLFIILNNFSFDLLMEDPSVLGILHIIYLSVIILFQGNTSNIVYILVAIYKVYLSANYHISSMRKVIKIIYQQYSYL